MTDDELVQAFEARTLAPELFPHAAHVRVAWWYLRRYSLPEGLMRFTTAVRAFAAANGAPDRYHETVTVGYFLLIADRLTVSRDMPWTEFAAQNEDLLRWKPSVLERYYTAPTLWSERARRGFVMPDRLAAGGA